MKDPLLINKLLAGCLVFVLIALVSGQISRLFIKTGENTNLTGNTDASLDLKGGIFIEAISSKSLVASSNAPSLEPITDDVMALASIDRGKKVFNLCKSCHTTAKGGPNLVGPNLYGVFNSKTAQIDSFKYSKLLAKYDGVWNLEELNTYLYAPLKFFGGKPGKMNFVGLKKVSDRASVIKFLNSNSDNPVELP